MSGANGAFVNTLYAVPTSVSATTTSTSRFTTATTTSTTSPTTSSPRSTYTPPPSPHKSAAATAGAIVGLVLGALIFLALVLFAIFYFWRKRTRDRKQLAALPADLPELVEKNGKGSVRRPELSVPVPTHASGAVRPSTEFDRGGGGERGDREQGDVPEAELNARRAAETGELVR